MEPEAERYQFDTVEVQPAAFAVLRDGKALDLEPKAVRVLLYLIDHRDRAVAKEELIDKVWEGTAVTDNALTRIVAQTRRELGDDARQARYIQTLPTTGYRFIADLRIVRKKEVPPPVRPVRPVRIWIAAAAVAVLILAASAWLLVHRAVVPPGELRSVQLTTSPGLDIGASFSPDGKSFVYSSNLSGRFEIYRRPVSASGTETQVTADGQQNVDPAWSPDGKWIAYHSAAQHGIWLVPVAGGTPHRLTAFGSSPAWSPDGRQIAFRAGEPISFTWFDAFGPPPGTIWTVAADGSQLRQVTTAGNPPGRHSMPAWSPDGKRLAFTALTFESTIWSLDLASLKFEMLVKVGRDIPRQPGAFFTRLADPRFNPAGRGLYFSAMDEKGGYAIYYLRRIGEKPVELYPTRNQAPLGVSVSPDGKRLLFTRSTNISQIWSVSPTADPKPIVQEEVLRAFLPGFSPDGKWLSFAVDVAGRSHDRWVMPADGTGAVSVSADPGSKEGTNRWNLQGTGLLYNYLDGERIEFRRYDPVRRTSQTFYSWPSNRGLYLPTLMPDEKEVLSSCSTPLNLCLSPAAGGPPRQITFEREGALYPNVSWDGQWITYDIRRGDTSQIGVIDRNGNHQETLTDGPGLNWSYSFSSDNRRIAYAGYHDGVWNLFWIDRITHERKQLTHNTAYGSFVRSPAWRPGTEEIVYEYSQVKGNIYLLDLP
jgi:Tol biopolymer transport system component/DNA-binding winged helix-turn-helix (wHTH) protein